MATNAQLSTHLHTLLPTLSPLPAPLLELATSLLAQSRTRASSLKAEEEIARAFACCHIACERLGKKLGLELEQRNILPPCKPKVYTRLKTFLGTVLRTLTTPRTPGGRQVTRSGAEAVPSPSKVVTSSKLETTVTPVSRRSTRQRVVSAKQPNVGQVAEPVVVEELATTAAPQQEKYPHAVGDIHDTNGDEDQEQSPVKRPSKTPLRRKEKHGGRDDSDGNLGPAGLLPGLGTMFQPAVDWLSDERRANYAEWEKEMRCAIEAAG
ncbi:hypothetical protein BAUCODRAFT_448811 [Baudoinia panamericana UAMH 10762]|uniref:ORC6 first cyclin-like domain-containing protein n=1 Tax=Baudoinia panamericana (strain UAMH 10762) TaxID=717646 RepID=M2MKX9_BAUPA|nr:uncharacterized protein BAUCODRAFT_448811 [Baudoinia panamericana UAMH 10762]EMC97346.1 hypothetical protein BAUCODRAFT_448811 [Baudoinia panamericana UAMH 10762]